MNLAIFQSIMLLSQKGLLKGLWIRTFNVLYLNYTPPILKNQGNVPKKIPKTLPSTTT
jgi:hypothetical protein